MAFVFVADDNSRKEYWAAASMMLKRPTKSSRSIRAFCPTGPGGGVDNTCSAKDSGDAGPGRVFASEYGMDYSPENAKVVEKAREVPDDKWNELPVTTIPAGTTLKANEETLKTAPIEKVVSGDEPFREGYVTKLWDDGNGNLHIVDGHHRVAMYSALGKDMPARVMGEADYKKLMKGRGSRAFCPTGPGGGVDNSCGSGKGGSGGSGSSGRVRAVDVSVPALEKHADKVAGGSYVDGAIVSDEFPKGAVVPRDYAKLQTHHADVKRQLAERVGVPSKKSSETNNSATTVDELLADARDVVPQYKEIVEKAAKDAGVEASFGEADPNNPAHDYLREHAFGTHMLKIPESLAGKVPRVRKEDNLGPEVSDATIVNRELKDAVRGSLIADTPEALGDAVRSVQQQAEKAGMAVSIKNRFEDKSETGYGAVHMTMELQTQAGRSVMTELQFHLRQAYDGNRGSPKDNSHGLYKPDPKTNSISEASAAAQMLIWSRAFDEVPPPPGRRRGSTAKRAFCPGASPPDNSCAPANKGDGGGSAGAGANKAASGAVKGKGKKVEFGTVSRAALDNMKATGGFSVHPVTSQSPTTGYMVSVRPEAEVIYDSYEQVNEAAFRGFYEANKAAFEESENLHFGGWVDTNTGKVYFDLSKRFEDIDEAIDAAQETNQLAIWHLDERREIRREDYEASRKRPRAQAVRSLRLSGWIGDGLQGDGGGVSGVRQKGDGRQARQAPRLTQRVSRAFCPGASPPDNSCSPSNKGSGGARPPAQPKPSREPGSLPDDPRGDVTGHTKLQRYDHLGEVAAWLSAKGVTLEQKDDANGPPSMQAMQALTDGVEAIERHGMEVPRTIIIEEHPHNAPAAYDIVAETVHIDPDLSIDSIRNAVLLKAVVGVPGSEGGNAIVHEMAHHEHVSALKVMMGKDDAVEKCRDWIGRPGILGPTKNPWEPGTRMASNSVDRDGRRVSPKEAIAIASEVSRYATVTPLEFVAETRAGLAYGLEYSQRVLDLYDDYLGPPVRVTAQKKKAA